MNFLILCILYFFSIVQSHPQHLRSERRSWTSISKRDAQKSDTGQSTQGLSSVLYIRGASAETDPEKTSDVGPNRLVARAPGSPKKKKDEPPSKPPVAKTAPAGGATPKSNIPQSPAPKNPPSQKHQASSSSGQASSSKSPPPFKPDPWKAPKPWAPKPSSSKGPQLPKPVKLSPETNGMKDNKSKPRLERVNSARGKIESAPFQGNKGKPRLERVNSSPGLMDSTQKTNKNLKPPRDRAAGGGAPIPPPYNMFHLDPKDVRHKDHGKKLPGNKLLEPVGRIIHHEQKAPGTTAPIIAGTATAAGLITSIGLQADWSKSKNAAGAGLGMACIGVAAAYGLCALNKAMKHTASQDKLTNVDHRLKALEATSQVKGSVQKKVVEPVKATGGYLKDSGRLASDTLVGVFKKKPTLDDLQNASSKPGFFSTARWRKSPQSQDPSTLVRRSIETTLEDETWLWRRFIEDEEVWD